MCLFDVLLQCVDLVGYGGDSLPHRCHNLALTILPYWPFIFNLLSKIFKLFVHQQSILLRNLFHLWLHLFLEWTKSLQQIICALFVCWLEQLLVFGAFIETLRGRCQLVLIMVMSIYNLPPEHLDLHHSRVKFRNILMNKDFNVIDMWIHNAIYLSVSIVMRNKYEINHSLRIEEEPSSLEETLQVRSASQHTTPTMSWD